MHRPHSLRACAPRRVLSFLALLVLAVATRAGTTFDPIEFLTLSQDKPRALDVADLDGDGDRDLLVGSELDGVVAWYPNTDGQGHFGAPRVVSTEVPTAVRVLAADLDGDDDLDVVAVSELSYLVCWFENLDGAGTFGDMRMVDDAHVQPQHVACADLDDDGDLDLVVPFEGSSRIVWFENLDGLGSFGPARDVASVGGRPVWASAADVDADGDLDVLGAWEFGNVITWSENLDGVGTFGPVQVLATEVGHARCVVAADLDGDDDLDALWSGYLDGEVAWRENLGGGVFGSEHVLALGDRGEHEVIAADLDLDGDLDVATASYGPLGAGWFENLDGQGTFGARILIHAIQIDDFAMADIDGDHDLDLVGTLPGVDKLGILRNAAAPELFVDLGHALPGVDGEPVLSGLGDLLPGMPGSLRLDHARPDAVAALVLGLERVDLPFKGGLLVPLPELGIWGPTTDAFGVLVLDFVWPADFPPGVIGYVQWWIADAAAVQGWAASNGLALLPP